MQFRLPVYKIRARREREKMEEVQDKFLKKMKRLKILSLGKAILQKLPQ